MYLPLALKTFPNFMLSYCFTGLSALCTVSILICTSSVVTIDTAEFSGSLRAVEPGLLAQIQGLQVRMLGWPHNFRGNWWVTRLTEIPEYPCFH